MSNDYDVSDLIFVGLNGYALALHRDTGAIIWSQDNLKSGYVTILLDGDRLIVSTDGHMFCLDPLTGKKVWYNKLKGYGTGPTALASVRGQAAPLAQADRNERRRSSESAST